MSVTLSNGETILLFDLSYKAVLENNREKLEAMRLDTLMRLGSTEREEGPIQATGVSVSIAGKE